MIQCWLDDDLANTANWWTWYSFLVWLRLAWFWTTFNKILKKCCIDGRRLLLDIYKTFRYILPHWSLTTYTCVNDFCPHSGKGFCCVCEVISLTDAVSFSIWPLGKHCSELWIEIIKWRCISLCRPYDGVHSCAYHTMWSANHQQHNRNPLRHSDFEIVQRCLWHLVMSENRHQTAHGRQTCPPDWVEMASECMRNSVGYWSWRLSHPINPMLFPTGNHSPIARFMGTTWGPSGADRTQVGPMLTPWTVLSGLTFQNHWPASGTDIRQFVVECYISICMYSIFHFLKLYLSIERCWWPAENSFKYFHWPVCLYQIPFFDENATSKNSLAPNMPLCIKQTNGYRILWHVHVTDVPG